MPNFSKNDVIIVRYPFSDLSSSKVRPAVVVHAPHTSQDSIIVPLTSRTMALMPGEFVLNGWSEAGLNVPTAVKRGIYTVHPSLVIRIIGQLSMDDGASIESALRLWLGL